MALRCSSVLIGVLALATSVSAGQNVVVVLDDSGSMAMKMRSDRSTKKMDAAKRALTEVLQQLPEDTQVGIVALNRGSGDSPWIVPLGPINQNETGSAIARIRPSGGTPLGRFMKVGADALLALRASEHYGAYRLLIVTDGEANDSDLVDRYLPDILSRGVTVDVIGVDMESDHGLATKVHSYRRADDPASLTRAISEVFAESSEDSGDSGESDFELVATIPNELAAAALNALSATGNHPIGTQPVAVERPGRPTAAPAGNVRGVPVHHTSSRSVRAGTVVTFILGFFCVTVLIGLVAVVGIVVVLRRSA